MAKRKISPALYALSPLGAGIAGSMKKGGKVKKTGLYKLHKGEHVTPANKSHRTLDR